MMLSLILVHHAREVWSIMRVVSMFVHATPRRCRRLGLDAGDMLLARNGGPTHFHVAWLGILGLVHLLARSGPLGWYVAPSLALFAALAVIVLFDARYFLIPDGPILAVLFFGAATVLVGAPAEIPARCLAAAGAWGLLRLVALAYERWRGHPGLGLGDASLFGAAGLWLGVSGLPGCLLCAALSGLVSAAILLRGDGLAHARQPIPFGPHLALGFWLSWAVGPIESGVSL
jgi:leader peptidase (prepilin peptidase)/N-methyltransferase